MHLSTGGSVQFPPYVDVGLACTPDDLPHVLNVYADQLAWHRVGTCTIYGVERNLCLAFAMSTGTAVKLGVLSSDELAVDPLPREPSRKIQLVWRERPTCRGSKTGISLLILQQVALHMEGVLHRDFLTLAEQGRLGESAVVQMIPEIFGTSILPSDVRAEDALFLVAATLTARGFYDTRLFGGRDNLDELIRAFDFLRHKLHDQVEELELLVPDLQKLANLHPSQMDGHAELQQHVTVYILALLRHAAWQEARSAVHA